MHGGGTRSRSIRLLHTLMTLTVMTVVALLIAGGPAQATVPGPTDADPARVGVAATAAAAPITTATVVGRGYGHGRGLGQYGAYGYATTYGWTYQQILAHYFGGTGLGRPAVAAANLTVRLTAMDGGDVRVTSGAPFVVGGKYAFAAGVSAVLRYSASGVLTVYRGGKGCAITATARLGTATDISIRSTVAAPGNDISKMLTVCKRGRGTNYRGSLRFVYSDGTPAGRRLVNSVTMTDYLKSVVPSEMPSYWADAANGRGRQAVQAQAVAARTYAAAQHRYTYARTCDTVSCQVYKGAAVTGVSTEDARTTAAVAATAGIAVCRANVPVNAEFSASTGGWTAGGDFPAVADLGDATSINPYRSWTVKAAVAGLGPKYGVGTLTGVAVASTDGHGRARTVRLTGSAGTTTISADQFRLAFGLRSTVFTITATA